MENRDFHHDRGGQHLLLKRIQRPREIEASAKKPDELIISSNQALDPSTAQVTPLPLVAKGVYSLVSDMKLGWKPTTDHKPKYLYEVPPVVAFKYPDDDLYIITEAKASSN